MRMNSEKFLCSHPCHERRILRTGTNYDSESPEVDLHRVTAEQWGEKRWAAPNAVQPGRFCPLQRLCPVSSFIVTALGWLNLVIFYYLSRICFDGSFADSCETPFAIAWAETVRRLQATWTDRSKAEQQLYTLSVVMRITRRSEAANMRGSGVLNHLLGWSGAGTWSDRVSVGGTLQRSVRANLAP